MAENLLYVEGLSKKFGGLHVLNNISLSVGRGELVGLIGPNGAGKTTLFNAVSGMIKPDSGKIIYAGRNITGLAPHRVARLGLRRTFQLVNPFLTMSVLENVMVSFIFGRSVKKDDSKGNTRTRCTEYLKVVGLEGKEDLPAGRLPIGQLRSLEIARALAGSPKILLADEVLAGLNEVEITEKLDLFKKLNEEGLTILMIEHNLPAIMSTCRRVIVLVDGQVIASGAPSEVVSQEEVITAYIGSESVFAS